MSFENWESFHILSYRCILYCLNIDTMFFLLLASRLFHIHSFDVVLVLSLKNKNQLNKCQEFLYSTCIILPIVDDQRCTDFHRQKIWNPACKRSKSLSKYRERERDLIYIKKMCVERKWHVNKLHFIYFFMLIRQLILKRFDFFICIGKKKLFVQDIQTVWRYVPLQWAFSWSRHPHSINRVLSNSFNL